MSRRGRVARPGPIQAGAVRGFTRGKEHPRRVVWFGARAFWDHLGHFVAAAIATENVDSRDWMTPDKPGALLARITKVLGGARGADSLTRAAGRDVFIDFVSDTGDDVAVSRAVARLALRYFKAIGSGQSFRKFTHPPLCEVLRDLPHRQS